MMPINDILIEEEIYALIHTIGEQINKFAMEWGIPEEQRKKYVSGIKDFLLEDVSQFLEQIRMGNDIWGDYETEDKDEDDFDDRLQSYLDAYKGTEVEISVDNEENGEKEDEDKDSKDSKKKTTSSCRSYYTNYGSKTSYEIDRELGDKKVFRFKGGVKDS